MKKVIGLLLIAILLSNCELKIGKEANAQQNSSSGNPSEVKVDGAYSITIRYTTINGMRYAIMSYQDGGVAAVNLTKDAAELKYYEHYAQ